VCPERQRVGLLCLALLAAGTAHGHDDDRALAPFVRSLPAAPRSQPIDAIEWERRLRPPDRFGPVRLREADSALLAAARQGLWPEVLQLVKAGQAHANPRDVQGGHVLAMAARAGQDEVVRELVRRGAELDRVGEDGHTALGAAAFAGRRSTVRLLVRAGADPARWGSSGQTALHLASLAGQMDVIDELLRLRVDIELLNRQRETALDVAAGVGQLDAMTRLIEAGADSTRAGQR
jgi:ankyrin repeat protein